MGTLVVISQVYLPDAAAVGQHIADAAEEFVRRGQKVVVLTSAWGYDDPAARYPRRESRNGVDVRRLRFSSFGKSSLARRLVAQVLFILQATITACVLSRVDAVLTSTSPPFVHGAGLVVSFIRRASLSWWVMDLNPAQIVASGRASPQLLVVRPLDLLNRRVLKRARSIIALERFMGQRLREKGPATSAIHVLPPWPLDDRIQAATRAEIAGFRQQHQLDTRFVVMYSGNHSPQNPLDTFLEAAVAVRDDDLVRFVFVGGGGGKQAVDCLVRDGAPNIVSLPYQPLEQLGSVLEAADLHVVTMRNAIVGINHPCKDYGVLSAGRPFLFIGPRAPHVGQILAAAPVGWQISHGDVDGAIAPIRAAAEASPNILAQMGEHGQKLAADRFARVELLAAFCYAAA